MSKTLTAERARELLDYDPVTGILRWRVSRGRVKAGAVAGYLRPDGYRQVMVDGRFYLVHRLAFLIVEGRWPHDEIDHEDHDRLNNRWKNLKETDNQGNQRNKRLARNNTSGCTGVTWYKRNRKWLAQIYLNDRHKYLGLFDDLAAAIAARKAAEAEYGFHQNHGRAA